MSLATKYRPKRFADVIGQQDEVLVISAMLQKGWIPPAVLYEGPFGTGKTTLARLTARAMLCPNRQGSEPCNACMSCEAMDTDNHLAYTEIDAASHGLVADIREIKDALMYRVPGGNLRVLCLDECHMLTPQAQASLLQILEEGRQGLVFMFCTTELRRMLPTIRSRCVELNMRLLTAAEITSRLMTVADTEGIEYDEKALKIIGTYVRGHVRDSLILLEQLHRTGGKVTEELTRSYLRLDRYADIYELLTLVDKAAIVVKLEDLLCNMSTAELTETICKILVDAYKVSVGIDTFTQVDKAWLQKVAAAHSGELLDKAEKLFRTDLDAATLEYGTALIMNAVFEKNEKPQEVPSSGVPQFRKPGK